MKTTLRFVRLVQLLSLALVVSIVASTGILAQEKSVKPGINKPYETVELQKKIEQFERANRDVVEKKDEILAACELKPGMQVADVGAGTGLFTRLFAPKIAPGGKVYAVDITKKFLDHVEKTCKEQDLKNVVCVLCTDKSTELPPESIDLAFVCNTYHHFEYPYKTLASIHQALRPGGRLIVIDFNKKKDVSPKWVFGHVRADQETVVDEIEKAGFKFIDEIDLMKAQFVLRFEKK